MYRARVAADASPPPMSGLSLFGGRRRVSSDRAAVIDVRHPRRTPVPAHRRRQARRGTPLDDPRPWAVRARADDTPGSPDPRIDPIFVPTNNPNATYARRSTSTGLLSFAGTAGMRLYEQPMRTLASVVSVRLIGLMMTTQRLRRTVQREPRPESKRPNTRRRNPATSGYGVWGESRIC